MSLSQPKGPQDVVVTGTFDNWSKTLPLVKEADGSFALQVPLPPKKESILYKYIVDGEWKTNPEENVTKDSDGIENNILDAEDLVNLLTVPGALIPETGLQYSLAHGGHLPHHETQPKGPGDFNATVMPKEEQKQVSVTGEPGIQIPQGKDQLSAFETFENTDPKASNENVKEVGTANIAGTTADASGSTAPATGTLVEGSELTSEDKEKQKKKIKRSKYKAKKKAKAAAAAASGGSSLEPTPSPSTEGVYSSEIEGANKKEEEEEEKEKAAVAVSALETGNGATASDYLGETPRVTQNEVRRESVANTQLNDQVREEFNDADNNAGNNFEDVEGEEEDEDDDDDVRVPVSRGHGADDITSEDQLAQEPKKDENEHTAAKILGAAGLGGVAGAGLGSLGSQPSGSQVKDQGGVDPLSSSPLGAHQQAQQTQQAQQAPVATSKDFAHTPATSSTATAVPATATTAANPTATPATVANPISTTTSEQPKTLDPKAVEPEKKESVSSGLNSEPLIPPVTGSDLPDTSEGKEVDASPVTKTTASTAPVATGGSTAATTAPAIDSTGPASSVAKESQTQEEEIIIAQGSRKEIEAAVEAAEGHDVVLEEIKPTKSQQERLTQEAKLAAQVDGPITIEAVHGPIDETSKTDAKDTNANATTKPSAKDVNITPAAAATAKPADPKDAKPSSSTAAATGTATKAPAKKTNTGSTPAKKDSSTAKKTANGTKDKEEKKGGFRKFLKKILS
ncbi:Cruciform DNA binding protein [Lodderomyces elongisporus]|uniref:Cruciform DNA binding protein n=1 Tax=Lodderomyces elongisporus TaxID=36914 RepID=UPI00291FC6CE|nr:Cruciform DNA binding protein [Lodderomyces elongisporus]WLF79365.1 Cruciform DNA binding protein [Lodderomyces elongisporus]